MSDTRSWRSQPASLIVLRAFLGVTFLYAGVQKLLDPSFLRAGSPEFIGTQLRGFAQGSPIGWALAPLERAPIVAGIGIAVLEIAIGLGTLAGVAPRAAAAAGFAVNLALTLSATWHVHPYFLGSDSIYAVAWVAYLVGLVERDRRSRRARRDRAGRRRGQHAGPTPALGRRELLRGATLAGATLATTGIARALAGTPAAATLAAEQPASAIAPSSAPTGRAGATASPSASPSVAGTPVAELSRIPVGGAIGFQAPGVGPAALVRLSRNAVVAYSRVCTHAGCLVGYDQAQRLLYCPCHGAEYDPARGAAVIAGPAPAPLQEIPVTIDRATGEVVIAD